MDRSWTWFQRWGALIVSLLALLALIAQAWSSGERIAHLEGRAVGLQEQISQRNQLEVALRAEVETWKAYVNALRVKLVEHGIQDVPEPPKEK